MGNGSAKLIHCFSGDTHRHHITAAVTSEPYDEGLGHSFCYIRTDALAVASTASSKVHHSKETTIFWTISSISVSANTATSLSTALADLACPPITAAAFESSTSLSSIPLQPVPRFSFGPLSSPLAPVDQGFLSGSIERGFMSIPLDHRTPSGYLHRSRSHGLALRRHSCRFATFLLRGLTKGIARTMPPPFPRPPSHLLSLVAASPPPSHPACDLLSLLVLAPLLAIFLWSLPHLSVTSSATPSPTLPPPSLPATFLWSPPLPSHSACDLLPLPPLATPPLPTTFLWSLPPLSVTSSVAPFLARPPSSRLPLLPLLLPAPSLHDLPLVAAAPLPSL